jgi:hypothetical protein
MVLKESHQTQRCLAELCGDLLYCIAPKPVRKYGNMGRNSFTPFIGV